MRSLALHHAYAFIGKRTLIPDICLRLLKPSDLVILAFHLCRDVASCGNDLSGFLVWLSRRFCIIPDLNWESSYTSLSSHKPKLLITVDDGTYDFFDHFMPVFQLYKIPFVSGLISGCLVTRKTPLSIVLPRMLSDLPEKHFRDLRIHDFPLPSCVSRDVWVRRLTGYLLMRSASSREAIIAKSGHLFAELIEEYSFCERMLSLNEASTLANQCTFANHSFSHSAMSYETLDFFQQDYQRSADLLASAGIFSAAYIFPFGLASGEQLNWLLAGVASNILLTGDSISSTNASIHPRILFSSLSLGESLLRVSGAFVRLKSALRFGRRPFERFKSRGQISLI